VLCCVFPVLWMTSHLAIVGRMNVHGLSVTKYSASSGVARPGRSLMSMNALLLVVFNNDNNNTKIYNAHIVKH